MGTNEDHQILEFVFEDSSGVIAGLKPLPPSAGLKSTWDFCRSEDSRVPIIPATETFEIEARNLCYKPPKRFFSWPSSSSSSSLPSTLSASSTSSSSSSSSTTSSSMTSSSSSSSAASWIKALVSPTDHHNDKFILENINCVAKAGEIMAIAGPSGAGKSTLLELLAGRIKPTSPSRSILVNKHPMSPQSFRRISGFVPQQDTLFPLLTVQETLMFSASLRLPSASVSPSQREERVQSLLLELGLSHVADSTVGDGLSVRGVSGGERRRVSIGIDVIHEPAVLLLDEPTSGLDSASALNVVEMLHTMAKTKSRTIILSIHQPGYRIIQHFNRVLLLAKGNVVHHGSMQLLQYKLVQQGHKIPPHTNVLEYAIEAIAAGGEMKLEVEYIARADERGDQHHGHHHPQSNNSNHHHHNSHDYNHHNRDHVHSDHLHQTHHNHRHHHYELHHHDYHHHYHEYHDVEAAIMVHTGTLMTMDPSHFHIPKYHHHDDHHKLAAESADFANSSIHEILILTQRLTKNILRTRRLVVARSLQALVAGVALGSIYMKVGLDEAGIAERMGFFAFTLTFLLSSSVEALPIFMKEREVVEREASRGAYRVSSYALANQVVFLPFLLWIAVLYSGPVYYMVGLSCGWGFFLLVVWAVLGVANAFVSWAAALAPDIVTANSVVSACMGSFFLFSGYFISASRIPPYWRFMHYLSLFKYPLDSLLVAEYSRLARTCFALRLGGGPALPCALTGRDVLRRLGLSHASTWTDLSIILAFTLFYRFLSYLVLRLRISSRQS